MADTPNNWISYDDYLGLTREESQRLEAEAMERAQQSEGAAAKQLRLAQRQAAMSGQQLQGVASYNDYLAAKRKAEGDYAALGNLYGNDFRGRISSEARGFDDAAGAAQYGYAQRAPAAEGYAADTAAQAWRETQGARNAYTQANAGITSRLAEAKRLNDTRAQREAEEKARAAYFQSGTPGRSGAYQISQEEADARAGIAPKYTKYSI